jgi:hypothetical protein
MVRMAGMWVERGAVKKAARGSSSGEVSKGERSLYKSEIRMTETRPVYDEAH